jgi:type IV pilus assembly protein PilA
MYNDIRKNENKGFSLVELIVVIAIMAVMTAVLAPSLLAYVERSRAQKDDSAMSEVVNAIELGLSDQEIYDEVLYYTCYGNVSCYVDANTLTPGKDASGKAAEGYVETKAATTGAKAKKAQYRWDDTKRIADETEYFGDGNMRGVTITFEPSRNGSKTVYNLSDGVINGWVSGKKSYAVSEKREADTPAYVNATPTYDTYGTFGKMTAEQKAGATNQHHYLFARTKATVGETIELSSQTYRNSSYTIFIQMGTTGGALSDTQDAVSVYGQWNGTNLEYTAPAGGGEG